MFDLPPSAPQRRLMCLALTMCCAVATSCGSPPAPQTANGYTWEQVAEPGSGAFPEEWSEGKWPMTLRPMESSEGQLWMISQNASWSSSDGLSWTRYDKADWGERLAVAYADFNERFWMFGGMMLPKQFQNDIWSSVDGRHWENAGQAQWPARRDHTVIAFKNKLWLFGGAIDAEPDGAPKTFLNDIWSSDDGLQWTLASASAPWAARDYPRVLVFHDHLFLVGGQGHADVWTSEDGVQWSELVSSADWGTRWDYGVAVFDDRLWVYGGREQDPKQAKNDVWFSADGQTWAVQTPSAPWSDRSGVHSTVFQDKLWLFSGKHTGADDNWGGDIWTMRKADPRP
jgi:hypothetical protein